LQTYERGYSDGELISFSTCSCVLWQKEQRNGSSGVNRFTGYAPLGFKSSNTTNLFPIVKRKSQPRQGIIGFDTNP
jgi:hypothetical protein